ncbi:phosphoethanolamine transferase [Deefgea rivuli]|uniref:phosphoethanolamine transferase n=1 Tax=Deefgea rivuli TaxID=400948 RepID=UPI000683E72D|nr:phosphoethanolamine--lipid A transferase [Deefgea rivuli]
MRFKLSLPRIQPLRSEHLTSIAALFFVFACNGVFWQHLYAVQQPSHFAGWLFMVIGALFLWLTLNLLLTLLALPYVLKPVLSFLLIITPIVVYFMVQFGVMINVDMLRNAAQTNSSETLDLLTPKLALYWLVLGGLPLYFLWRTPLVFRPFQREALIKIGIVFASAILLGCISVGFYKEFASVFRNHRELRFLITPMNYIQATSSYLKQNVKLKAVPVAAIGLDAQRNTVPHARPTLTVIVVGETARAANFSLNGYAKDTNPRLKQTAGLINLPQMRSCGTDTAVSVPCMFSMFEHSNYSADQAKSHQGLLDVVQRAGFDVLWRDNQSGCKGACDRIPNENTRAFAEAKLYQDGECLDEALLQGLQEKIDTIQRDTVIVLHMMGSHGPAYYKRYPAAFAKFQPTCDTAQLDQCTQTQITNSYDNSLLYTDFVLSNLIDLLRKNSDKVDTAMTYLSDHGESLGERGLYLHGAPYLLAPDEQTHIPAMLWLSPEYAQQAQINLACLQQRAGQNYSHDNLFHSTLGLLNIKTALYQQELDWYAPCRNK